MVNIFTSTACAESPKNLDKVVERFYSWGIRHIELSAPHPYMPRPQLATLLTEYMRNGVQFIAHNYFPPINDNFVLNIASIDPVVQHKSITFIGDALDFCVKLGIKLYGVHCGYVADGVCQGKGYFSFQKFDSQHKRKAYSQMIRSLTKISQWPMIKNQQIRFVVENLFPIYNDSDNCCFFSSPAEIAQLFDQFDDNLGFLLDLGHWHVGSHLLNFDKDKMLDSIIEHYGSRVCEIHLSGNNGLCDDHLPLKKDDWQLRALRRILTALPRDNEPIITLEARRLSYDELSGQLEMIGQAIHTRHE